MRYALSVLRVSSVYEEVYRANAVAEPTAGSRRCPPSADGAPKRAACGGSLSAPDKAVVALHGTFYHHLLSRAGTGQARSRALWDLFDMVCDPRVGPLWLGLLLQ